jgi:hypothetical protein
VINDDSSTEWEDIEHGAEHEPSTLSWVQQCPWQLTNISYFLFKGRLPIYQRP